MDPPVGVHLHLLNPGNRNITGVMVRSLRKEFAFFQCIINHFYQGHPVPGPAGFGAEEETRYNSPVHAKRKFEYKIFLYLKQAPVASLKF